MNQLKLALFFFSLIGFASINIEAKSLELTLDHTTQKVINIQLEDQIDTPLPSVSTPPHIQKLTIENLGDQPIKNCFPCVNLRPCLSLERLASYLASEKYPLLTLYHTWNRFVAKIEGFKDDNSHPLDILNFKGACSPENYQTQFIRLCNALGIETRIANVHDKTLYDFCIDQDWSFLDLANQQIYLGWNNEKLISSEEIMDDPFLALRTKSHRNAKEVDFKEAWKQLAHFEILESTSAMPIYLSADDVKSRSSGLDLYPQESLFFGTKIDDPLLENHERVIIHTIDVSARQIQDSLNYSSPFPIFRLENQSTTSIELIDQKITILPGENFTFNHQQPFDLKLAFQSVPKGKIVLSGICSAFLLPSLSNGKNLISIGLQENPSIIRFQYEIEDDNAPSLPAPEVSNIQTCFDYVAPSFDLLNKTDEECEMIWWQISPTVDFQLIPPNFDQIEPIKTTINLPLISETFFNPETTYYFRIKVFAGGKWSEWSKAYEFTVNKPAAVEEVEFNQLDDGLYELNWERCAEESDDPIEYLVFGSNSLDFIPSIYCSKQVNAIVNNEIIEEEINDNLITITREPKVVIQGGLAYYRIIAKKRGQYSVPSALIHVYDQDLIQPRNILQVVEKDSPNPTTAKRTLFPPSYPGDEVSLPHVSNPISLARENCLIKVQTLLRSAAKLDHTKHPYEYPIVEQEIWEEVRPYLLPANHPAWPKLNRIFCRSRATLNPDAFKKAGFKRWRPGRWSRVSASSHPDLQEYFIKAYCDCEMGIIYDWKKWIHRIKGAETIRDCIKKYKLQSRFKVPHKWIYPLPKNPSPPKHSRVVRKNFILVAENMQILDHDKNEKYYKKKMTQRQLDGLYKILQVCGLYDSVYCFNIPFCKDGRIAVIDTEYHHKWPVPFHKLTHYFSKSMAKYWEKITYKGGRIKDGVNQPNPPRMDRRDVPRKNPPK